MVRFGLNCLICVVAVLTIIVTNSVSAASKSDAAGVGVGVGLTLSREQCTAIADNECPKICYPLTPKEEFCELNNDGVIMPFCDCPSPSIIPAYFCHKAEEANGECHVPGITCPRTEYYCDTGAGTPMCACGDPPSTNPYPSP